MMNKENTERLVKEFPQIFIDRDKPPTQSLMCFGLECGDGWFELIRNLCSDIMKSKPHPEFRAIQIKEKFGGLRFYIEGGANDKIWNLIDKAEQDSYKTCEECGIKENVTSEGGWVTTRCPDCRRLLNLKRAGLYDGDDEDGKWGKK